MSASQARHDNNALRSFCTAGDNSTAPLRFTADEVQLLDPLEKLALKMMVQNRRAVIEKESG